MNDDTAVREMLHDLALGQPDAPVDRFTSVRRRHVRRRSLQGATTVVTAAAAAVAVLLGAGVLTGGTSQPKSLQQPPPKSWQLPWPDRSTPGASAIKAQALAYLRTTSSYTQMRDVRWLFAGDTGVTWAVFEETTGINPTVDQLIAMSSLDSGQTWAVSADEPPSADTKQIGFVPSSGKWLLVLTAPGVEQVGLGDLSSGQLRILPEVDTGTGEAVMDRLQTRAAPDALLVGSPDLTSTFVVRFPDGGHVLPAWQRALLSHAPRVPGYRAVSSEAGAAGTNGSTVNTHGHYSGPMLEVIRCAGQTPLAFSMTASGQTSTTQIDRCDGQSVTLHLGTLGRDGKYSYTISGDPTAIYAMAVYVQKAQ